MPRPLDRRLVGNCRRFSVLLVAMLRHQGVPARARCGFGAYFLPNHFEDHWVVEYWNQEGGRWVFVDAQLDELQREVDDRVIVIIARRQPMAEDLREIIGTIRIAAELERIGDLGKSNAKRVAAIAETRQPRQLFRGLEALSELALTQLKDVLDVYASRRVEAISQIRDRDEEIDAVHTSLFRELLTYMMEDPRKITSCTHLLFCAKNIERIGDHATNIAEIVFHIATGEQLPPERPKVDQSHKVVVTSEGTEIVG